MDFTLTTYFSNLKGTISDFFSFFSLSGNKLDGDLLQKHRSVLLLSVTMNPLFINRGLKMMLNKL